MNDADEYLEYLCLYSNNVAEIKAYVIDNRIDVNNVDILKVICLRNNYELFNMFLKELKADFTIDNFQILKHYAIVGNIDKLKYLIDVCKIDVHTFVSSCKTSTFTNSNNTKQFLENL